MSKLGIKKEMLFYLWNMKVMPDELLSPREAGRSLRTALGARQKII
jgi:hypothetical protein